MNSTVVSGLLSDRLILNVVLAGFCFVPAFVGLTEAFSVASAALAIAGTDKARSGGRDERAREQLAQEDLLLIGIWFGDYKRGTDAKLRSEPGIAHPSTAISAADARS